MATEYQRTKIRVEQQDIDHPQAVPSVMHCPTARALCRRLSMRIGDVRVWHDCIQIGPRYYRAPENVNEFERKFSAKEPVEPFAFVLSNEPIEPVLTTRETSKRKQ